MVQTHKSQVRLYKHPFELVMAAYEKRFPCCPEIPIFVGSEITAEQHSKDGAKTVIERKCKLNVDAPYLLKKAIGVHYIYFNQKNSLDRRNRTLHIEATNITFSQKLIIKENCIYYVHPENSNWTCFSQSASLEVKSFYGFETVVENIAAKQYAANLARGKEIMEHFIENLLKDGITHIQPFSDISSKPIESSKKDQDEVTTAVSALSLSSDEQQEGKVALQL